MRQANVRQAKNILPAGGWSTTLSPGRAMRSPWWLRPALVVLLAPVTGAAQNTQQTPLNNLPPRPSSVLLPEANRPPDANAQMEMREQQTKKQDYTAANVERRKQIADDTARLLKMAADLKAEVDKTSKDTLSLNVIRKADEIERLAHDVKEKMKLTAGGS